MAEGSGNGLIKAIEDFEARVLDLYGDHLERPGMHGHNAVATGTLRDTRKAGVPEKKAQGAYVAKIYLQNYWTNLEHGQPPGTYVPIPALQKWIDAKKFDQPVSITYRGERYDFKARAVVSPYAIQSAIAANGTRARNFLQKSVDEATGSLRIAIAQAMREEVVVEIGEVFKRQKK